MIYQQPIEPHGTSKETAERCESCGSDSIVPHERGRACTECGLVVEAPVLASDRPYNADRIQNQVSRGTSLGTRRERLVSGNAGKFDALQRLQAIKDGKRAVEERARREIRRIFESLHLPPAYEPIVLGRFRQFRSALKPGTKYRSPDKLAPLAIYFTLKLNNAPIDEKALLEASMITKKEFNAFRLQVVNFVPEYARRNRIEYMLRRILEVSEHFSLGTDFYYQSKALLYKFHASMACTTDDVLAGVATSLALLCYHRDRADLSVNQVCKRLGIRMSTVQSRVKRIVEKHFKQVKFESLIKSRELLNGIIDDVLGKKVQARLNKSVV